MNAQNINNLQIYQINKVWLNYQNEELSETDSSGEENKNEKQKTKLKRKK